MSRYYRLAEFVLLFIGVPLLINAFEMRWLIILVLWAAAATIFVILKKTPKFDHGVEWNFAVIRSQGLRIIGLFLLSLPFLAVLTYFINPDLLFSMPRTHPQLWAVIMVLYPVLSVWPQELIFRSWIYHRYPSLWRTPLGYIVLSATAFGFVHLIFHNWIAVIMSAIGGIIFASTYLRSRSLVLCCLEHALYGCAIFTIGLGHYFYSGAHFH